MNDNDNIIYVDFNRINRRKQITDLRWKAAELAVKGNEMIPTATNEELAAITKELAEIEAKIDLLTLEEEQYGNYKYFN